MAKPHLFTNPEAIKRIKSNLQKYEWYRKSFQNIQRMCDVMLEKGFEVPKEKGYVFNETCRAHNAGLIFDPYNKSLYICPVCKAAIYQEGGDFNHAPQYLCNYCQELENILQRESAGIEVSVPDSRDFRHSGCSE